MDAEIQFIYKDKAYFCDVFMDFSEAPFYIFAILKDASLIREFGEEISIKIDFEKLLPKRDDNPELILLRQSIFDSVKTKRVFIFNKEKYKLQHNKSSSSYNKTTN